MGFDLLEHREALTSVVVYGTIAAVVLWETFAEFRSLQHKPLVRWSNNILLGILGFALERWLLVATGFSVAMYAQHTDRGLFNQVEIPEVLAVVLTILFLDCLFYWLHRAWHATPILWRIHCVHHSDTEFDFSVAFRRHPIELLVNVSLVAPLIVILGLPAIGVLLFQLMRSVLLFVEHANVRIPGQLDSFLRYVFVTPNMHRVHHSSIREETDSNYSDMFTIWDRLFGSYREHPMVPQETMQFGLEYFREPGETRIHRMLLQPARYDSRAWGSSENGK